MALFGIKRIQYCKATQLAFSGQNNPFLGIASEPTNTFTDIVCLVNSRATLTIEQAVVNKQIVYTAKLQFVTPADPMLDVDHYAFIATTNEGERILLGANTRPQVAVVTAQGVFGNAGELTAYTTTAEFKADYRPLRLPVTAAEPISGPAYDICCGQIPQPQPADNREFTIKGGAIAPENEPADDREFTICCGEIQTKEPISGPEYDVCCGEIQGEVPIINLVIWQDYYGTEISRATYDEGEPEPTGPTVANITAHGITFSFYRWNLIEESRRTKIYRADMVGRQAAVKIKGSTTNCQLKYVTLSGQLSEASASWQGDYILEPKPDKILLSDRNSSKALAIVNKDYTELDWSEVDAMMQEYGATTASLGIEWLYNADNVRIGYKLTSLSKTITVNWYYIDYYGDYILFASQTGNIGAALTIPTVPELHNRTFKCWARMWQQNTQRVEISTPMPAQIIPENTYFAIWNESN